MGKPKISCNNCKTKFKATFKFCPNCGQKSNEELTLAILFKNTIANYFSVDARFFKSFIPLMTKPGYLAQRFLEGQRLQFLHPAQMYLFTSIILFFLFSFIVKQQSEEFDIAIRETINASERIKSIKKDSLQLSPQDLLNSTKIKVADSIVKENSKKEKEVNTTYAFNVSVIDSLIKKNVDDASIYKEMGLTKEDGYFTKRLYSQVLKFLKTRNGGTILSTFYGYIPVAMLFILPVFAFVLKLFFYKNRPYVNHLVFSFYFFSFLYVTFSSMMLVNFIWSGFPYWLITILVCSTFIYFCIAIKQFYKNSTRKSIFKSVLIFFVFLMIIPFSTSIMAIIALLFY